MAHSVSRVGMRSLEEPPRATRPTDQSGVGPIATAGFSAEPHTRGKQAGIGQGELRFCWLQASEGP
jgi:hypothetical protein